MVFVVQHPVSLGLTVTVPPARLTPRAGAADHQTPAA
jgi:hypothetical protein